MKALLWFAASFLLAFVATGTTLAQSITVEPWRGHKVLRLSGPIEIGLADDLMSKLELADTWAHGAKVLLLDSPLAGFYSAVDMR